MDSETREMVGVVVAGTTAFSPVIALGAYLDGALTPMQAVLAVFAVPLIALLVGGWIALSFKMFDLTERALQKWETWGEN